MSAPSGCLPPNDLRKFLREPEVAGQPCQRGRSRVLKLPSFAPGRGCSYAGINLLGIGGLGKRGGKTVTGSYMRRSAGHNRTCMENFKESVSHLACRGGVGESRGDQADPLGASLISRHHSLAALASSRKKSAGSVD